MIDTNRRINTFTPEECEKIAFALAARLMDLSGAEYDAEGGNPKKARRFFLASINASKCADELTYANDPANFPGEDLEETMGAAP